MECHIMVEKVNHNRGQKGSILIGLIITMAVFAVLSAAIVPMFSTSHQNQVTASQAMKAYYMAESGFRYAASEFLNGGAGEVRDTVLTNLHGKNYALGAGGADGSFDLNVESYYYNSPNTLPTGSLVANAFGNVPSGVSTTTGVTGYLAAFNEGSFDGFYTYSGYTPASGNITFTISGTTGTAGVRVFPSARAYGNATTLSVATTDGELSLFPLTNGTFRVYNDATNNVKRNATLYRYASRTGNQLQNISIVEGSDSLGTLRLLDNDLVILQRYIDLTSIGKIGDNNAPFVSRRLVYRTPVSAIGNFGGGSTPLIPPDPMDNKDNWLPNNNRLVHGEADIDSSPPGGGGNALVVSRRSGSNHFVLPASSIISDALKGIWSWNGGLSYDAQVKVLATTNISYGASMYFRRHREPGGTNTSFGISIVYLKDYNDRSIDVYADKYLSGSSANNSSNSCYRHRSDADPTPYCILATGTPYLVLWRDTAAGPSSFKTIAYYELPGTSPSNNYPAEPPYWPTLMVRIKENPSAPSYCGTLAGTRVNELQFYYSKNETGSGDSTATNTTRVGNLRNTVNWPPATGGTNVSNDHFTLVSWSGAGTGTGPAWTNGSYEFGDPGDGTNTVICTNDKLTNISTYGTTSGPATNFPPEVALAALGSNIQNHIWFDDFAIQVPGSGGSSATVGFLPGGTVEQP